MSTLRDSRDRLDQLAHTLLERETLDENEAYAAAGIGRKTVPAVVSSGMTARPLEPGQEARDARVA